MTTYYADTFAGAPLRGTNNESGVIDIVGGFKFPAGVAPVAADIIKLVQVPANCYIDFFRLYHASWGTTVTGKIGLAAQDDDAIVAAHAFQTSRVLPYTYLADAADAAATGVDRTVKFATDLAVTSAVDDLQIVMVTCTSATAATELKFQLRLVNFDSARLENRVYTWNGEASGAGVAST